MSYICGYGCEMCIILKGALSEEKVEDHWVKSIVHFEMFSLLKCSPIPCFVYFALPGNDGLTCCGCRL